MRYALVFLVFVSHHILALNPIVPESVLSPDEIQQILQSKDFFNYHSMDETSPIWKTTHRKYSRHYLGNRTHFFSLDDVIHRVLTDGFPIQYKIEQLYRAKLGIQTAIGDMLPRLDIGFGEGAAPIVDVNKVFSGVFGFLLPANWMKLANQTRIYEISKLILLRTVLDEILRTKLLYLDQHQTIQEFEILNFYFIHLQILARQYPSEHRGITTMRGLTTLIGEFASEGTEMGLQRGKTKLGFDDLALLMALEKIDNDYSASTLNIKDLENFPDQVKDLEELEPQYQNKEHFVEEVVRNSVELKIVDELYKVSQLDIGVTASGNMFSYVDRPNNPLNEAKFAFRFGYGTLPNILISKSFSNTAKIDVQKEYLNMLDVARRSFDTYTNSLGGFTEAKRSLEINRMALIQNIEFALQNGQEPDALFILALKQLINTELKLNNALHGSLRARAYMDRFLLVEESKALKYLPKRGEILSFFEKMKIKTAEEVESEERLDTALQNIRRVTNLRNMLFDYKSISRFSNYSEEVIVEGVRRNVGSLLYSNVSFYKKALFFEILENYFKDKNIELTAAESYLLKKKKMNFMTRLFKNERAARPDYTRHFETSPN